MGGDERHCELLPVGLVSTIVFDLDVEVETPFRAVDLLALVVRAHIVAVDFFRSAAHMLFSNFVLLLLLCCGQGHNFFAILLRLAFWLEFFMLLLNLLFLLFNLPLLLGLLLLYHFYAVKILFGEAEQLRKQ